MRPSRSAMRFCRASAARCAFLRSASRRFRASRSSGGLWPLGCWALGVGLGLGSWTCFGSWALGRWELTGRVLLVPEKFRVGPRVDVRFSVPDLDDLRRQLLHEVAVVRDDDEGAAVVLERVEEHILRVEIEMVRRLVEEQRVGRPQEHAGDREPRALATGQHARLLVDIVAREEESAEDVADGWHHVVRRPRRQRLYTVSVGSSRVASSCAKYSMTT